MTALALALLLAAPPQAPEELERLVERVLQAYGGEAALKATPARVEEGSTSSLLHPGEPGRTRRVVGRDGSLRVEVRFGRSPEEVRMLHDGRASRNGADVTGTPPHAAMLLQAARLQLPLLLHEARRRVTDLGLRETGGRPLRVLELALPGGMLLQVGIDMETARILRSAGGLESAGLQFATEYADFRKVKGILVPFREENFAQGRRTGETVLEKVQVLADPPPGTFGEGRSL